jgi:hypothetical protein
LIQHPPHPSKLFSPLLFLFFFPHPLISDVVLLLLLSPRERFLASLLCPLRFATSLGSSG